MNSINEIYTINREFTFYEDWNDEALCRKTCKKNNINPELWFPDKNNIIAEKKAIQICRDCPVRLNCLEYAIRNDIQFGIWGGMTANQRHKLSKNMHLQGGRPSLPQYTNVQSAGIKTKQDFRVVKQGTLVLE